MRSENVILGVLIAFISSLLGFMFWVLLEADKSGCDLGPPVYVNSGGISVPTYPFMECPK